MELFKNSAKVILLNVQSILEVLTSAIAYDFEMVLKPYFV